MKFRLIIGLVLLVASTVFARPVPTPIVGPMGPPGPQGPPGPAGAIGPRGVPGIVPIVPATCTHQAGVEFSSQFNDGISPVVGNCPGFAATRLSLPIFTTLQSSTAPTELGFDNSVSQGYGGQIDYLGFVKFTNPSPTTTATLTLTVYIGPTTVGCDWTDPADCGGLYPETTTTQIVPGQTAYVPFHQFIPTDHPQVEYMFLTATTTAPLTGCAVQYQSSECGGTAN